MEDHASVPNVERALGHRVRIVWKNATLLAVLATIILHTPGLGSAHLGTGLVSATSSQDSSNLTQLSVVLFHELLLPFEVTSVLILIAILGAVALARAGHGEGTATK